MLAVGSGQVCTSVRREEFGCRNLPLLPFNLDGAVERCAVLADRCSHRLGRKVPGSFPLRPAWWGDGHNICSQNRNLHVVFLLSFLKNTLFAPGQTLPRRNRAPAPLRPCSAAHLACPSLSSKHRAKIPQISVATGRRGCACKCLREKRLCDSSGKGTMAFSSCCRMASKFL